VLKKEKRLIITFSTTTSAFKAEKSVKAAGIRGRLIPLPQQISAECGLALCCFPEDKAKIDEAGIHGGERYFIEI
jgi:hypothetical protein